MAHAFITLRRLDQADQQRPAFGPAEDRNGDGLDVGGVHLLQRPAFGPAEDRNTLGLAGQFGWLVSVNYNSSIVSSLLQDLVTVG